MNKEALKDIKALCIGFVLAHVLCYFIYWLSGSPMTRNPGMAILEIIAIMISLMFWMLISTAFSTYQDDNHKIGGTE